MANGRNRPGYTPKIAGSRAGKPNKDTANKDTANKDTANKDTVNKDAASNNPAHSDTVEASEAATQPAAKPAKKSAAGDSKAPAAPSGKASTRRKTPVAKVSTLKPGEKADPQSNADADDSAGDQHAATGRAGLLGRLGNAFGRRSALILAALAAIAVVIAVLAVVRPGAADPTGDSTDMAFVDRGETTELISQASSKVCDAVAADGTNFDAWAQRAQEVLTGSALDEFNEYLPTQRDILAQSRLVADCRVETAGVRSLTFGDEGPRARVVVALVISESVNETALRSETPHAELVMEKHGDQWLIARVEVVGADSPIEGVDPNEQSDTNPADPNGADTQDGEGAQDGAGDPTSPETPGN